MKKLLEKLHELVVVNMAEILQLGIKRKCSFSHFRENFLESKNFFTKLKKIVKIFAKVFAKRNFLKFRKN
jgi:hypothetical protein